MVEGLRVSAWELVRPTGFEDEGGLAEQAKIRSALEEPGE